MIDYRYLLIRYMPNPERVEPINVGVILQGAGRLELRLSAHVAKQTEIDTGMFDQWREFLRAEIEDDPEPLFQPDRASPAILQYLEQLCDGTVVLSRPLLQSADPARGFEDVPESLYQRLVAPPALGA